jgi:hypothetical protein
MAMSERAKIEEKLRKKEQEVATLDDKLRAARIYVSALRDILKMLGDEADGQDDSETILRPGSAVAQAREVILKRKAPVHINDLLGALGKSVTRESKASLTSSLAAYVRKGEIFSRPAPSTFGLIELGHQSTEEEDLEPPADFGRGPPAPPTEEENENDPFYVKSTP